MQGELQSTLVLLLSLVLITFQRLEIPLSSEDLPPAASPARSVWWGQGKPRFSAQVEPLRERGPGGWIHARSVDSLRPDSQKHRQMPAVRAQESRLAPEETSPLPES